MATFEEKLQLAREINKKIAAGQKVGQIATADLIRQDALPAADLQDLVAIYPKWLPGVAVQVGDLYSFNGMLYEVIQAHSTQADWTPDITPALWKSTAPTVVIPDWVQPAGAHDAYKLGDKVTFEGKVYESTIDGNVWSSSTYPQGWRVV